MATQTNTTRTVAPTLATSRCRSPRCAPTRATRGAATSRPSRRAFATTASTAPSWPTAERARSSQADPRFAAPDDGNLTLNPGSPAVDSALSTFLSDPVTLPRTDAFGSARVDDLGTPNTGAGPRPHTDRGAYEAHNTGFETDTSGWNTSGSAPDVTITRAGGGHTGAGEGVLKNGGSSAGDCQLTDSPNWVHTTAAGTYTATMWVRADRPGATLKLRLREWSGATSVGQATKEATLSTDWQPVRVEYTAGSPGASTLDLLTKVSGASPGVCFHADDASIALR